jgi:hypothetical protein
LAKIGVSFPNGRRVSSGYVQNIQEEWDLERQNQSPCKPNLLFKYQKKKTDYTYVLSVSLLHPAVFTLAVILRKTGSVFYVCMFVAVFTNTGPNVAEIT